MGHTCRKNPTYFSRGNVNYRRYIAIYWIDEAAEEIIIEGVTRSGRDLGGLFKQ